MKVMNLRKGHEIQKVVTHRVVHVGDDYVVVEEPTTSVKTAVDLNKAGELEGYELISHGSPPICGGCRTVPFPAST